MANKMALLVFGLLAFAGAVTPQPALAATGDVTAVRIEPNGWVAEVDVAGFTTGGAYAFGLDAHNNPTNPTLALHITSPGFDANGNATTISRTVYATQWVRKAYPANTNATGGPDLVKDESAAGGTVTLKVSLSDFVYAGDTSITATVLPAFYKDTGAGGTGLTVASSTTSVQNNATLTYPKPVGRWAWPGYERMTGDFPVEAAIFDRFPVNGSPVAVVMFTATDQHGHSVTVSSNTVTVSSRPVADANPVQVYAATIPVASFTPKDVITVNFKAYPWVGNAGATLDSSIGADGVAQPTEELGPLMELNDSAGTYGVGYALVSPTSTTTGTVYSSQSAAEAGGLSHAFPNIGRAAEAIKAFQFSNFGRNSAGGGVILLSSSTNAFPGYAPDADMGAMDTWLIVRPASNVTRDQAVISSGNYSTFNVARLKFDGITVNSPNGGIVHGRNTDAFWMHNSSINTPSGAAFYGYKVLYATQNQILSMEQGLTNYSVYRAPYALIRGNTAPPWVEGDLYAILGNKNIRPKFEEVGNGVSAAVSDNSIYAFNTVYKMSTVLASMVYNTEVKKGIAFVMNSIEGTVTVQPLLQLAADSSMSSTTNVMLWHNTFAGQRANLGYNDSGSVAYPRLNWSQKFNIYENWNNKDDRFTGNGGANANRTGGWPVGYNVGSVGNLMRDTLFPGEFNGISSFIGGNPKYVRDASTAGTSAGNGDYTLTPTSAAIDIASTTTAFDTMLPYDLRGNSVAGLPDAGAYEYQSGPDVTAPTLSSLLPTGTLAAGTSSTTLSVATNEAATCAYSTTSGIAFASMTAFSTTGATTHATTLTGLSDGQAYTYYVKCKDSAGNTSGDSSTTFSVAVAADTTAPMVALTVPTASSTVSGIVSVTATSTDAGGVAGVQFKLDGALLGAELTVSPYSFSWNTASTSNGSHTLLAVARDTAGNRATSTAVTVTVNNADVTPPTVSLTAPSNGATVSGTTSVTASASDNLSVVGVQLQLDGVALGSELTSSPYTYSWSTGSVTNGSHSLVAIARDAAGNYATSTTVTVTVNNTDTTVPTVSITAPSTGSTVSATTTVSATASDNIGVVGVQLKLDGIILGSELTTSPYTYAWNTASAANGSHVLTAVARDAAGNYATSTVVTVTVNNADGTAPTVALTAPSNGATVATTTTVTATASDNIAVIGVQLKLDGTLLGAELTSAPYTFSWNTGSVANGSHTLTAIARDGAGNYATSTSVTVTVNNTDTTAPTVSLTAPSNGSTASATTTVTATASDNIAVAGVQFKLDGAPLGAELTASPYTYAWNTTSATSGSHTLVAVARDAAGNYATSTSVTVTVNNSDVTVPTVSLTAPSNGATVATSTTVTATASDNIGVVGVQMKLDGALLGSELTSAPYTLIWNTASSTNASHTLVAVARDAAGNIATSTAVTVTVNNVSGGGSGDISAGLIGRYTFDQSDTSTTTASDSSGSGHPGTLVGSPTSVTSTHGQALSFNGSNYVNLGTSSFGLTNAYSVSFWVMQTANGSNFYANVIGRGMYVYPFSYQIAQQSTINSLRVQTRTSNGDISTSVYTPIAKNQWYHVVGTYDNGARKLYVNGTQALSDTMTGNLSWNAGEPWLIGKLNPGVTDGVIGAIDEVRIYNRALTQAEVTTLSQQ